MLLDKNYILQDFIAAEVARMYSNERKEVMLVSVGDNPGWDVSSVSGDFKVEVKMESSPIRTNNVCIEYRNTELQKPSGVEATEANIWLHIALRPTGYIAYEYQVNNLRELIKTAGFIRAGGYNSLCRIIDLFTFEEHAQRVFPFKTHFIQELLEKGMVSSEMSSTIKKHQAILSGMSKS
ncbi:MAG: hypothetical protein ACOYNS_15040 [Bacteroidota bacterium]